MEFYSYYIRIEMGQNIEFPIILSKDLCVNDLKYQIPRQYF